MRASSSTPNATVGAGSSAGPSSRVRPRLNNRNRAVRGSSPAPASLYKLCTADMKESTECTVWPIAK